MASLPLLKSEFKGEALVFPFVWFSVNICPDTPAIPRIPNHVVVGGLLPEGEADFTTAPPFRWSTATGIVGAARYPFSPPVCRRSMCRRVSSSAAL